MKPKKNSGTRQVQIRYATESYPNALFGTYTDTESAMRDLTAFRDRCVRFGQHRVADSAHLA